MTTMRYAFGLVVTAALLAIGHWLPWPRRLRSRETYTYGVGSILIGLLIWLGFTDAWLAISVFAVVGGLVTGATYLYDRVMNWRQRAALFEPEGSLAAGRTEDS